MYSVILVDDEPVVREGLTYIIDWERHGFTVVGSAENGVEGLEMIRDKQPDLVITDIKMPGLDGLEMVKEAQKINAASRFIILSGYSDFKYAQDAISLRTLHYLLKPIDETELIDILTKLDKQFVEEGKEKRNKRLFEDYVLNQHIFSYIMTGIEGQESEKLKQYTSFQLLKFIKQGTKLDANDLISAFPMLGIGSRFLYSHGDSVYMLDCDGPLQELEALAHEVVQSEQMKLIISSLTTNKEAIPSLYKEIEQLTDQFYFYPNRHILSLDTLQKKENHYDINTLMYKLKLAIKDNAKKSIEIIIDHCLDYFIWSDQTVEEAKREWSFLFMGCVSFLEESSNKPVKEIEKDKILSIIWKEKSIIQTAHFLKYVFYDFGRFFYETNEKLDIIEEIKQYTSKNYHQNLSLIELAKQFNYSQSYLGKKFKTETQMSYHTYLDDLRLNKAKQLLEDHVYYIYEIAEMVGYSNYDYFHKKFKKKYGLSPKEHQKNCKEEEGT